MHGRQLLWLLASKVSPHLECGMGRVARFFRLEKAEKWLLGKVSLFSIADAVDIITVFTSFDVGCVVV
ncbi:MAG: hypothetical protein ACUVUF_00965 [Candidatus Bathycorpusculaceae bacterium]